MSGERLIPMVIVESNSDAETNSESENPTAIAAPCGRIVTPVECVYRSPDASRSSYSNEAKFSGTKSASTMEFRSGILSTTQTSVRSRRSMSSPDCGSHRFSLTADGSPLPVQLVRRTKAQGGFQCDYKDPMEKDKCAGVSPQPVPCADVLSALVREGLRGDHGEMNASITLPSSFWSPVDYCPAVTDQYKSTNTEKLFSISGGSAKFPADQSKKWTRSPDSSLVIGTHFSLSPMFTSVSGAVTPEETSWTDDPGGMLFPCNHHMCSNSQILAHSSSTPHMDYQRTEDQDDSAAGDTSSHSSQSLLSPPLITLSRPASMNEFHCTTQSETIPTPNRIHSSGQLLYPDNDGCDDDLLSAATDRRKSAPNFAVYTNLSSATSNASLGATHVERSCTSSHQQYRSVNRTRRHSKPSLFFRVLARKKLSLQENHTWNAPGTNASTFSESPLYLSVPKKAPILSRSFVPMIYSAAERDSSVDPCEKQRAVSIDFGLVLTANKRSSMTGDVSRPVATSARNSTGQLSGLTNQLLHRLSLHRIGQHGSTAETVSSRKSSTTNTTNLPDWTINSSLGEHLWNDCPTSTDVCHLNEECCRSGAKKKCSVCRITCHVGCMETLQLSCRPTYREADVRDYRTDDKQSQAVSHHWISRRRQESRCKACAKCIQPKFTFVSKEMVAMQCTWCKASYHNRPSCFSEALLKEPCSLGAHAALIVPPDWIIKMPEKNTFKSSIRRASSMIYPPSHSAGFTSRLASSTSGPECLTDAAAGDVSASSTLLNVTANGEATNLSRISPSLRASKLLLAPQLPFVIKSNPTDADRLKPLLVFLNPRSGGNQGLNLLRKFQWLLNPRQVFDLTQGGPRMGLELFNRVPNLRILACGGDGTVGWVFSTIDELKLNPTPPVAVLPLGTGNDLARTLHWGSGYADEPISKILRSVEQGEVVALDRWQVDCTARPGDAPATNDLDDEDGARHRSVSSTLPLKVFNNYFSLGADAATALEFHESREANPDKFNSRLKNKIFYAGCGGKDLILRSWRDLCEHITLVCDGKDLTPVIRSIRPHVILFLNIPRYGSGTLPWGQAPSSAGFEQPRIDDGLIEVIGLSSTTLALLQVGGHGDRICQCRTVTLTTHKTIPMQMDGEPCRLAPAVLQLHCSHQALVVQKQGRPSSFVVRESSRALLVSNWDQAQLLVFVISMRDYQEIPDDALTLRRAALFYGSVTVKFAADLGMVRSVIVAFNNSIQTEDHPDSTAAGSSGAGVATDVSDVSMNKNGSDTSARSIRLSDSWAFIDSTTAATRFFRIDQKKESSHFITDICNMEELFLIDAELQPRLVFDEPPIGGDQTTEKKTGVQVPLEDEPMTERTINHSEENQNPEDAHLSGGNPESKQAEQESLLRPDNNDQDKKSTGDSIEHGYDTVIEQTQEQNHNECSTDLTTRNAESNNNKVEENPTNQCSPTHRSLSPEELESDSSSSECSSNTKYDEDREETQSLEELIDQSLTLVDTCDSSSSLLSQHTCEIELASSEVADMEDNDHKSGSGSKDRKPRRRQRRYCANQSDKVDELQVRLDRAFLSASRKGSVNQIEELLAAGANILAVDERGRSGLHLAVKFGCERAVQTLLKYASPKLLELREYEKSQTALHKAAVYRRRTICQLLLKAGACPITRDAYGKRPRRLAHDVDDHQLAHYLQREEILFIITHGRNKITV